MQWTCPRCDRSFGAVNRGHVCAPAMPVELWLDDQADPQRRAAEAVLAHLRRHKDLVIEAVSVGILVKLERTIIELRPKKRWLDVSFIVKDVIDSPRIARTLPVGKSRFYVVHLRDKQDVDAELRRWLSASVKQR